MANKILTNPETTVEWRDSGGDEVITLAQLASGVGRNGAIHDWGAAPRASRYHLKFVCRFDSTPVVGEFVRIYIREGGLTASVVAPTNDDGDGDVALSALDKLKNLMDVAALRVTAAATDVDMAVEAIFETAARQFGPVVFNAAADDLHGTASRNFIDITPIPDEIQ